MSRLSPKEHAALLDCEERIERNLIAAGDALRKIRDERLYRHAYDTWEEYVRERWGISARTALRWMRKSDILSDSSVDSQQLTSVQPAPLDLRKQLAFEFFEERFKPLEKLLNRHAEDSTKLSSEEAVEYWESVREHLDGLATRAASFAAAARASAAETAAIATAIGTEDGIYAK